MNVFLSYCRLASLLAVSAAAAPSAAPEKLEGILEKQKATLAAIPSQKASKMAVLEKWYADNLEVIRKHAVDKGDLDLVLAAKAESARVGSTLAPEEIEKLPAPLPNLRKQLEQARAALATWEQAIVQTAARATLGELETLEKQLTQAGAIDEALKVRAERAATAVSLQSRVPAPEAPALSTPAPEATAPPAGTPGTKAANAAELAASSVHATQATIPANSPDAFSLGALHKGSKISLQYSGGLWKSWGRLAHINPDGETVPHESCRAVIALPSKDGQGGAVLAIIPAGTAKAPFVFEVKSDYPGLVLRINDVENSFASNPGSVQYSVTIMPPPK